MSLIISASELAYDPINGPREAARRRAQMFAKPVKKRAKKPAEKPARDFNFSYAPAYMPPGGNWFKDHQFIQEITNPVRQITAREICDEICQKHQITQIDLRSACRPKGLVLARREAVYRMRTETNMSFPMIGRVLRRDHSTCVYSYQIYTKLIESGAVQNEG